MPIYMKYEGIMGTGKGKYYGWIPLVAAQPIITSNLGLSTAGASSKPKSFVLKKFNDKTSILLIQEVNLGKIKSQVTIEFVQPNEKLPYLIYQLDDTNLSHYDVSASSYYDSVEKNSETYILDFSSMSITYNPQNIHESTHAKYSVMGVK